MKKNLRPMIQARIIYNQDIGTKFNIENSAMLIMKSEKRETVKRNWTTTLGEMENYKYEVHTISF